MHRTELLRELLKLMRVRGISKSQLARMTQIRRNHLYRLLDGKGAKKTLEQLVQYCREYDPEKPVKRPINHQKRKRRKYEIKPEVIEMLSMKTFEFFGLNKNPFEDGDVEPSEFWRTGSYDSIEGQVHATLKESGFLVISGESGAGKSIIAQKLIRKFSKGKQLIVEIPSDFIEDVSQSYIVSEIIEAMGEEPKRSLQKRTAQLNRMMLAATKQKKRVALFIDESHLIQTKVLKALKRYHEGLVRNRGKMSIVLLGQPEILEKLEHSNLREVRKRVYITELNPLAASDMECDRAKIKEYIEWKLKAAGGSIDIFSTDAIVSMAERVETPQDVNELCIAAMVETAEVLGADAPQNQRMITANVINEV